MRVLDKKEDCCGCGACYQACPYKCISMEADMEGFSYPIINSKKCVNCGLCRVCCPSIEQKPKNYIASFAGINLNNDVRMQSSSGGIFSVLAEKIIELGGVVIGASYDDNFFVRHEVIDNKNNLYKIRGSKYVQSDTSLIYKKVKDILLNDKYVLFSGTECQIAGLKKFLKKDYEKLFCVGILCHGVPSPKVWDKYLRVNEKKYGNVKNVNFREKSNGWNNYLVKIKYEHNIVEEVFYKNDYMKLFLGNIDLRPSCYNCKFKGIERICDLTLGDAWNIQKITSEFNDDLGTSLIIVNSLRGSEMLELIKKDIRLISVLQEFIFSENKDSVYSVRANSKRTKFFQSLDKYNFNKSMNKIRDTIYLKIKRKIKKFLRGNS